MHHNAPVLGHHHAVGARRGADGGNVANHRVHQHVCCRHRLQLAARLDGGGKSDQQLFAGGANIGIGYHRAGGGGGLFVPGSGGRVVLWGLDP